MIELFEKYNLGINPGIAVMVIKNQKVLIKKGYGLKNLMDETPILSNSNFNLASLSKAFTAAGIALLEEQGLLSSADRLRKFFMISDNCKDLTIKHLIHHCSGLPYYSMIHSEKGELVTNDLIIEHLKNVTLEFKPAKKFDYNDTNYILLASIIEKVTSLSFGKFLKNTIFTPCQMKNTIAWSGQEIAISERVIGYSEWPFFYLYDEHPGDKVYGDGAIFSSLDDLYHWIMALENNVLFSEKVKQLLFTPGFDTNYGYGWIINKTCQRYYHEGEWVGFRHSLSYFPDKKMWIVILSNSSGTKVNSIEKILRGNFCHDFN